MREPSRLPVAALLLTTSVLATAQPEQMKQTTIQIPNDFSNTIRLYNEENGYWGKQRQTNPEILRDLLEITPAQWRRLQSRNEANGYW
jgi:hypothetical protein